MDLKHTPQKIATYCWPNRERLSWSSKSSTSSTAWLNAIAIKAHLGGGQSMHLSTIIIKSSKAVEGIGGWGRAGGEKMLRDEVKRREVDGGMQGGLAKKRKKRRTNNKKEVGFKQGNMFTWRATVEGRQVRNILPQLSGPPEGGMCVCVFVFVCVCVCVCVRKRDSKRVPVRWWVRGAGQNLQVISNSIHRGEAVPGRQLSSQMHTSLGCREAWTAWGG